MMLIVLILLCIALTVCARCSRYWLLVLFAAQFELLHCVRVW